MTRRKHQTGRAYPPDFVSADTLAYRLDCSASTIEAYVRDGLLPQPERIGNLPRWDFAAVVAFIKSRNEPNPPALRNGILYDPDDPYLEALGHGPPTQR